MEEQMKQLNNWLDKVFTEFIKQHGPFKTNEEQILEE